jgi:hypothetical protein
VSRLGLAVVLAAFAGCYNPTPALNAPCGPNGECPTGLKCNPDNRCTPDGSSGSVDAPMTPTDADIPIDSAAVVIDARPDAPVTTTVAPSLRAHVAADGSTTTTNISSPAGTQVGDLLLAHVVCDATTSDTLIPTPAGWTRALSIHNTNNDFVSVVFYRFAVATSESFTFTFTETYNYIELMAFSGVKTAMPIDASNIVAVTDDTIQPTAPSITTTQPNTLLVTLYTLDVSTDTFVTPTGMTPIYDLFTGELSIGSYTLPVSTASATGTKIAQRTGTDIGPTINASIALAPK